MGTFSVEIGIGSRDHDEWVALDALVDTGAFVTSAPASLLRRLGVEPIRTQEFELADGEMREMEVGEARVRVGDREVTTLVLFNDEARCPCWRADARSAFFMRVDPVHKRLVPIRAVDA